MRVEMTNPTLNFKFWLASVENHTANKTPLTRIFSFLCLFVLHLPVWILSCFASQISAAV